MTAELEANKDAAAFPPYWVEALRNFVDQTFVNFARQKDVVVTVIPHRPGRQPRLEMLLHQFATSIARAPLGANVICIPDLLAYTHGVRSNHNEFLNRIERFENVRDHLVVNQPSQVTGSRAYLVIDDVVTTGASLIYAQKRLEAAGAREVKLLGLGKNVGDIYAYT